MTKIAQRLALVAIAVLGLFTGTAHAQKFAVVDVNAVVQSLPDYLTATKKIEDTRMMWMDSLKMMQSAYSAKMDAYAKVGDLTNPDAKKKRDEDIAQLEQAFTRFRDAKFGQEGELAQMQASMLKPVQEKLTSSLAAFAKKEGIAVIFPKSATVYAAEANDCTTKFQAYLKGGK